MSKGSKGGQPSSGQTPSQSDLDHRAKQLNPNNDEYWKSRGEQARPEDWEKPEPESKHPPEQGE
jgi:hypothetical protein